VWLASKKSPDDYFRQTIEEKIKLPKDVEVVKMDLGPRAVFTVSVLGDLIRVEKKLEFKIDKFACPECSRQHSEWASKIQLRRRGEIPVDDILAMASKHKMRIIKTEQKKNGLDLYFFTKSTANKLASKLVKRFGYSLKRSYEQHGHDFDVGKPKHREIISLK
jgi:NMD protein affecting ribosome stability and mRNA decay